MRHKYNVITKRQRIKLRSRKYNDMKPHVFDKLLKLIPSVMMGIDIPKHCDNSSFQFDYFN